MRVPLILALAVLVTGLISPVSVGASAEPAIHWGPCAEAPQGYPVRCGMVSVPVDWDRPDAEALGVRVARLAAARPEQRIGTLVFNPGGPGGPASGLVASPKALSLYFPRTIRDRFDIVGIDPRGVGGSQSVECPTPPHDPSVSRFPDDPRQTRALVASNQAFARSCRDKTGPLAAHLDTDSVARDFDAVRHRLGEDQISFLGLSYGTMIAQSYAERFPDRLRALVLDGVVDRSRSAARMARDTSRSVQQSMDRFYTWCAGDPTCALPDARRAVTRVLESADAGTLHARQRAVTAEEVAASVTSALNMGNETSQLAAALRTAADTGDANDLISKATFAMPALYTPYRTIICQDMPVQDPSSLPAEAQRIRELGPSLRGASEFWDITSGCAGWPVGSRWQPHPWQVPDGFHALLLSGSHDVATPRSWAESVHRQLPGSELVRWDGLGHTAWLNNQQAKQTGVDYLINGPR